MNPLIIASPGSGMADAFLWLLGMGALGLFAIAVVAALTLGLAAFAVHKLGLIEYATGRRRRRRGTRSEPSSRSEDHSTS